MHYDLLIFKPKFYVDFNVPFGLVTYFIMNIL